ncbi:hypothetical protein SAMN05216359_10419 [Roseateles sp. YR242]|uniref:hypothetical protein n=1 Tax=Roseateles sp. YR242 TaxID=1855305 RepID=UPI0008BEC95D|nr:hypothetical protein [Roseateles sp. YR242]SEK93066.1 hypothetical protein SAMN05216359_10419 [Roseateles sp. YR242]
MVIPDMASSARQAALLLHSLDESDRAWMLGQLAPAERAEAQALLAELTALGVPSDPELLQAVLAEAPRRSGTTEPDSPRHRLEMASAAEVAELLRAEPDALIARLLRETAWAWHAGVLDRLGPARHRRIVELMTDAAAAPWGSSDPSGSLGARLADALAVRLSRPLRTGHAAPRGWICRLVQRLSPRSQR